MVERVTDAAAAGGFRQSGAFAQESERRLIQRDTFALSEASHRLAEFVAEAPDRELLHWPAPG